MSGGERWNVGRLLEWTTKFLKEHGSESGRLDAELLLAQALGCKRIDLYTRYDEEPAEPVRATFRDLVRRRSEGMPVAYLLGRREFYSLDFAVTPDVLIPRPETELVVVGALDLLKKQSGQDAIAVADVGTGSGIIGVSVARHDPRVRVTAIDRSEAALEVARRNAAAHGVGDRIEFLWGDLFAPVADERQFQLVLSNPPYVTTAELAQLPRDVAQYEPQLALDGGTQGTAVIERLVPEAAARLAPGGQMLLEVSPMIEAAVRELIAATGAFEVLPTIKDFGGRPRVVVARRL
ncbi:MAG: peptide chain release factor N(5)-glutamine methyltransferase [Pirellulales bacterium]|nr:peptide chain release factor N(5)-glutamine methyltransferase [Pirellulales bacterium]